MSLSLLRSGNLVDSKVILDNLLLKSINDIESWMYNYILILLKESRRYHDITLVNEILVAKSPKDIDTLTSLFNAYLQETNMFAAQQRTAMKLFTVSNSIKKNTYLFWYFYHSIAYSLHSLSLIINHYSL